MEIGDLPAQLLGESPRRLTEIVFELADRPGHEKVRALIHELLVNGLHVPSTSIDYEHRLPEVHGRMDAFLGRTVLEFKSDLRREKPDAEEELTRYLGDRKRATGLDYIGVATDGAIFIAYELKSGALRAIGDFKPNREAPAELLVWLDGLVNVIDRITPDPGVVRRQLGRDSLTYAIARDRLIEAWSSVSQSPDCILKRQLWRSLMSIVYGSTVDDDDLFIQHTYLTVVAKTMAVRVLGLEIPPAADLLSGAPFDESGIYGAVESDFFDWVLEASEGASVVNRIATQTDKFKLAAVTEDVLKALYESLVDPSQRHELGEYYTPDWLAALTSEAAIPDPLVTTALDPACGSGTFLFHAVRRYLDAAAAAGVPMSKALEGATEHIRGIDIHPVAVMVARVTFLLAIGEERLALRRGALRIPVYMGDSLQWDASTFLGASEVRIRVPDGEDLEFPVGSVDDPSEFENTVSTMLAMIESHGSSDSFAAWLSLRDTDAQTAAILVSTFERLAELYRTGRDHVWAYVIRNLARPVWLSSADEKSDVLIGNPPWLSYQFMSNEMKDRFRRETKRLGIWEPAQGRISHQDMSGLFFARCLELYVKPGGKIALVMPLAATSRAQFAKFRSGQFGGSQVVATARFTAAWEFDNLVSPLFPVPSCVLFAEEGPVGPLPKTITAFAGHLPVRNASLAVATQALVSSDAPWPELREHMSSSIYSSRFRQGAIIVPRMLFIVERAEQRGILGTDPSAPLVTSRRTSLEKAPWKNLPGLTGPVEKRFLRPAYLGESVALFKLLQPAEAVIPWDEEPAVLLSAARAREMGYLKLAEWLSAAETLWAAHGKKTGSIVERLDYIGQLSAQFPLAPIRVVYATSGSQPAASLLMDGRGVIDHKLYWSAVRTIEEGKYLVAILNSEETRGRIAHLQSQGQFGARDFHKTLLSVPIPEFDPDNRDHTRLVKLHDEAAEIAQLVDASRADFKRLRHDIREAIRRSGTASRIDAAVARLLDGVAAAR